MTEEHVVELALVQAELASTNKKLDELSAKVSDLVDAWKTANGVVRFVKWVASIATACGILLAAVKGVHR